MTYALGGGTVTANLGGASDRNAVEPFVADVNVGKNEAIYNGRSGG